MASSINKQGSTPIWLQERAPIYARHYYAKSITSTQDYAGDRMMIHLGANEDRKDQLGKTFLEQAQRLQTSIRRMRLHRTKYRYGARMHIRDYVDRLFGGTKIAPEDLQKVQQFVDRFDSFKGRAALRHSNLAEEKFRVI